MRTLISFCIFISGIWVAAMFSSTPREERPVKSAVHDFYSIGAGNLHSGLKDLLVMINKKDQQHVQQAFLRVKEKYKYIELLVEYYSPELAEDINGGAIDESEPEAPDVRIPAEGFQVIEEYLFPVVDTANMDKCAVEVKKLQLTIDSLQADITALQIDDSNILDALRMQVFRVTALGISGFDSPLSNNGVRESGYSLEGVRTMLSFYKTAAAKKGKAAELLSIDTLLSEAIGYLKSDADFNTFDRMIFIRHYANEISKKLMLFQEHMDIPFDGKRRPLNVKAADLFAADAFDPIFYIHDNDIKITADQIKLGLKLFNDPILSGNGKRSCGSCHQAEKAFTDDIAKEMSTDGLNPIKRNTPTLINASLQPAQFYDQRVRFLEDQIQDVVHNTAEMHGDLKKVALEIRKSSDYETLFNKAYPGQQDIGANRLIQKALVAYICSLVKLNSPFDKYMQGRDDAMTVNEVKGFNLFMGKGKCGTCHFMPLFNGVVPPSFTEGEAEVLGVPSQVNGKVADEDLGKFAVFHLPMEKYAFKTPTLRNVALTAPYMHNGVYKTLEEVIEFYNNGGGSGLGIHLENQTLSSDSLKLSQQEQQSIIAFLHTLTDTSSVSSLLK